MFKNVFFYLVFLFVIVASFQHIIKNMTLSIPLTDLTALRSLDYKKYDSITLGLEPYRGVMLAANFLDNMNLYSIEDSYFPKIEFNPERITSNNPVLTTEDSCLRNLAIDFTKLTSKLVLISKVSQPDKNTFSFNRKPYCNGMKLQLIRGFSGIEEWGIWSDGERTELAVETSEAYPRGGRLILYVRPVINPNLANDQRMILVDVDGKHKKSFQFASDKQAAIEINFEKKDLGSNISIIINHLNPIKFSDISGSDPRRVSLGFLSAKLMSNGDSGQIQIASVTGAYDRETDGRNWWHWVERKVAFQLQPLIISKEATQAKLHFEYGTRGKQTLTVHIRTRDGSSRQLLLHSEGGSPATFEKIIDLPPSELTEVSIETDGRASRLGEQDARIAALIIRNVNVTPISP